MTYYCLHKPVHLPKNRRESLKPVSKTGLNNWNTNLSLEHSVLKNRKTTISVVLMLRISSTGKAPKPPLHLNPNRNFRNLLVNGRRPVRAGKEIERLLPVHNILGSRARSLFSEPVYVRNSEEKFELFAYQATSTMALSLQFWPISTLNNIAAEKNPHIRVIPRRPSVRSDSVLLIMVLLLTRARSHARASEQTALLCGFLYFSRCF